RHIPGSVVMESARPIAAAESVPRNRLITQLRRIVWTLYRHKRFASVEYRAIGCGTPVGRVVVAQCGQE
ncbi:MAG: hypothetical protein KDA83_07335, partial [Planctomycetales bacterium]|nr:hypothetical protein [Planctomycetales bacterium]